MNAYVRELFSWVVAAFVVDVVLFALYVIEPCLLRWLGFS
jgi:hypothetical protein